MTLLKQAMLTRQRVFGIWIENQRNSQMRKKDIKKPVLIKLNETDEKLTTFKNIFAKRNGN
jgi:hypothetical protein